MQDIDYNIIRSRRRKTASIIIHQDNRIEVRVPYAMPGRMIRRLVHEKHNWIARKLHFNAHVRTPAQAKQFTAGESFLLRGEHYKLQLQHGPASVQLDCDKATLTATLPRVTADAVRRLLTHWYRQQALAHFSARCAHIAADVGKQPASVGIKTYKSRWGSCFHDGRIYFNWLLIMAPDAVIDDVVAHELCHLIHHNHSAAFHQLLNAINPESKAAQQWLKIHGNSLNL